ncbi:MAG: hypothetical protein RIC81_09130 [Microcella pacifica]|uniref:Uncharacterized protein n=1 Tax=Microcella pacifica TaxID=2591847 RepID=A0A9E5JK95_9MICO|nr:hypothetical protein [Microcella pacifica]MBR21697.1 hypothetical protein [Leifsonia sp.]NHF61784.1 hypothetical protein [Microcella pacifica]
MRLRVIDGGSNTVRLLALARALLTFVAAVAPWRIPRAIPPLALLFEVGARHIALLRAPAVRRGLVLTGAGSLPAADDRRGRASAVSESTEPAPTP